MSEQPSMMQMMRQARAMQKQMKQIQKRVEKQDVSVTAAGGKIEVVISGKLEVRRVILDPSLLENPDKLALQNALKDAFGGAIKKAQNLMAVEMQKMAADLGLPPGALGDAMGDVDADGDDDGAPGDDGGAAGGGRLSRWFGRR